MAAALSGCHALDAGFEEPGPTTDCIEPDVDELPFDRDSIEPMVIGRHRSTLEWRGPGVDAASKDADPEDVVFTVRKTGELRWGLHCGGYARFDAAVDVELSGGGSATFRGDVYGRKGGAEILSGAKASVADTLSLPEPRIVGRGAPGYGLSIWIDSEGSRGSMYSQSDTAAECERARWPAGRACARNREREEPFDTKFGDFDFGQVSKELKELQPLELRWEEMDASTTLELTIERGDRPVCVDIEYGESAAFGYRGRNLTTTFDAHVKTGDGRIDADVPLSVSLRWSGKRGVMEIPRGSTGAGNMYTVTGEATHSGSQLFKPFGAEAEDANSFQSLRIQMALGSGPVQGALFLSSIHVDADEPQIAQSAAQQQMSLDGVCIEGASRREDLAHATFGLKPDGR